MEEMTDEMAEEVSEPKSELELQSIVKFAVEDAIDFIESEISDVRNKCQRYMEGGTDLGHEEGRSKVVATPIRDTVRIIMPNLMRIFLAAAKPVEFVPRKPQDAQAAQQATEYVHMEFERLGGFEVLYEAFRDAVVKKNGFVKCYWDEKEVVTYQTNSNMNEMELSLLMQESDVEIEELEISDSVIQTPQGELIEQSYTVKTKRTDRSGCIKFDAIPPEDFFIDEGATCLDDALCYGHQSNMRVTDLVSMGFDFEEVKGLGTISEDETTEKYERASYAGDYESEPVSDPAMQEVTVTEVFMRVDVDNTGQAEWHRFLCGGKSYKILEWEPWSGHCIAVFQSDPEPHLFFGNSIPELLFNDADAATMITRGILDNVALVNNPGYEVKADAVNMDDMLNNEIGNITRVTQMGAINPLLTPFVAGSTLPALEYLNANMQSKTGVNNMSAGLDPEILQSQTAAGVNAMVEAGAHQLESIARHLAKGGLTDLYRIMLGLVIENSEEPELMRVSGSEFTMFDPRSWNRDYDMAVNVGLGNGTDDQKVAALQQVVQLQKEMAANGMYGLPEPVHNAVSDLLAIPGIHNVDRYFPRMTPEQLQQMMQPQQQGQDSEALAYAQAEKYKADSKAKTDQQEMVLKFLQFLADDDLQRDQMDQDRAMAAAEIAAKYGAQVDTARIKQEQAQERDTAQRLAPIIGAIGGPN